MAKLQRKSAKVFAELAQATVGGIAQFGSLAAGNIQYSKDVDVIQGLEAYQQGWQAAVVGNKSPAMEDRNALDYLLSYQQAYIMQHGIPEWLSTETYYVNSYVVDANGELRVSTIDNNTGHDPIQDNGGQYWGFAGSRGSGKQLGEVYYSQSSLATDNKGALPLFTGDIISNANNLYPQFYAWVLSHSELCKTQADYDTAISTYGECPYYVIDDTAKTIRLPKLVNYIKMANTSNKVTQSGAGLPNITGTVTGRDSGTGSAASSYTGAFYAGKQVGYIVANGQGTAYIGNFDASRSSSVYGNSTTVTPAHTTLFPWVQAYSAAIPASTAQAAQFEQALISKADVDLSNVTFSGAQKDTVCNWQELDWASRTSWTENSTAPVRGVVYMSASYNDTTYYLRLTPNGQAQFALNLGYNNDGPQSSTVIVNPGDKAWLYPGNIVASAIFVPYKIWEDQ